MKNAIRILTFVVCAVICGALLSACAQDKVKTITDIPIYSDMAQDGTDTINVDLDNNTGEPFRFTVEDEATISEIMELIFNTDLVSVGTETYDGDNTFLTIIQGEKEYRLSVRIITNDYRDYVFSTSDLQNKIYALAKDAGAFPDDIEGGMYASENTDESNPYIVAYTMPNTVQVGADNVNITLYYGLLNLSVIEDQYEEIELAVYDSMGNEHRLHSIEKSIFESEMYSVNISDQNGQYGFEYCKDYSIPTSLFVGDNGFVYIVLTEYANRDETNEIKGSSGGAILYYEKANNMIYFSTSPFDK